MDANLLRPRLAVAVLETEQVQMGDYTSNLGYRFYPNALCLEVSLSPYFISARDRMCLRDRDLRCVSQGSSHPTVAPLALLLAWFMAEFETIARRLLPP